MRKGQFTLEFVGAAVLFIITVLTVAAIGAGELPQFRKDMTSTSLNMEAKKFTDQLVSGPGYHDYGSGGTDWQASPEKTRHLEEVGLASDYLEFDPGKIAALQSAGSSSLNYSRLKNVENLDHNYRISFTEIPVIHTSKSFVRESPPPNIVEPHENSYSMADNKVHYGTLRLGGTDTHFLVAAHDGIYDTLYASSTWDFAYSAGKHEGDNVNFAGTGFRISKFQNRGSSPGTSVILSNRFKTFGGTVDRSGKVIKLNRYGTLGSSKNAPLVRMEVLAW